jgi:hypothetical protein
MGAIISLLMMLISLMVMLIKASITLTIWTFRLMGKMISAFTR